MNSSYFMADADYYQANSWFCFYFLKKKTVKGILFMTLLSQVLVFVGLLL